MVGLFPLLLLCFLTSAQSQTQWDQDASNPVVPYWSGDVNDPSAYYFALGPTVIYDESLRFYRMWFSSLAYGFGTRFCISEAISLDGSTWYVKSKNLVLRPGNLGSFDSQSLANPCIVRDSTGYKLYYSGGNGSVIQIGLATSSDGKTWTKHPANPVLQIGAPQSWDDTWVRQPAVIIENGVYKMWYDGYDGTLQWSTRIGYATSSNGVVWIKSTLNPVISAGPPGSFDFTGVGEPAVVKVGQNYHLTFTGYDSLGIGQLGYAYSGDGTNWIKYPGNPMIPLGPPSSWNDNYVASGAFLFKDGSFHVWYPGKNSLTGGWQIGHATSDSSPVSVKLLPQSLPTTFTVSNYPNPFNPETAIEYSLPASGKITIRIFDILGQEVTVLFAGNQDSGTHVIYWNGKNSNNNNAGSGTYFAKVEYENQKLERRIETLKLLLLK